MFIHTNQTQKVMTKHQLLNTITHFGRRSIAFEPIPVEDDGDELTQAVNDPIYHDNHWDLRESIDGEALEKFWSDATKELGPEGDSFTD